MSTQAWPLLSPCGIMDAVHEFAGHASAAEFIRDLQIQSHGEVLVRFHGHAVGHDAVEHQAVGTDFTEIELNRLAILQSLDFIDAQRIQLGRNHLHVLRVIRALRLDSEEVRLGGELHELRLVFKELHFANVEFFFFRAFPTDVGRAIFYGLPGSLRSRPTS